MAVHKRLYRPHVGEFTSQRLRFLVPAKFALATVFESRPLLAFYVACFVPVLISTGVIYLAHSPAAQALLDMRVEAKNLNITSFFFARLMIFQSTLAFLITAWIGPGLISTDLSHDALPLYLSRPFSRPEYLLGKFTVIAALMSSITWVPGLFLFFLQADLGGWDWFAANYWMISSILLGAWMWIALLGLMTLALSAWVKWRIVTTAVILGVFFVMAAFAEAVNDVLRTNLGSLLNISYMMGRIWFSLFRIPNTGLMRNGGDLPTWSAWMMLLLFTAACLFILNRRLRAREVVS